MRVNIEVPAPLPSAASTSLPHLSGAPPTLVQLASSGELVLIELQGSLEIDDADPKGGQMLGKLEFHPGREDRPTLLISHHRLEGRLVSLTKPFAVLQKKKRRQGHSSNAQEGECEQRLESSPVRFVRPGAAEGFHLDGENDDDDEGPASPSMARKRARKDVLLTPHKVARADKAATIAASSSPLPRPPMRGSELDFSSPLPKPRAVPLDVGPAADGDEAGQQEWLHRQSTSTYFEVVCIIRKKILFSKRPEPVVRLDGEGGEKARLALGLARAETSLL